MEITFYVNQFNSTWSSVNHKIGSRRSGSKEIKVQTCDLAAELRDICEQIHFVKIDIEGYDEVALKQLARLPTTPKYVSVENGSLSMLATLGEMGFDGFKFSNQKFVYAQQIPEATQEGIWIEHTFENSSSGMFGDDLPGRWMSRGEAQAMLEVLKLTQQKLPYNLMAETIGWFDMHARHSDGKQ